MHATFYFSKLFKDPNVEVSWDLKTSWIYFQKEKEMLIGVPIKLINLIIQCSLWWKRSIVTCLFRSNKMCVIFNFLLFFLRKIILFTLCFLQRLIIRKEQHWWYILILLAFTEGSLLCHGSKINYIYISLYELTWFKFIYYDESQLESSWVLSCSVGNLIVVYSLTKKAAWPRGLTLDL